jgi:hypothetical protein
MNRRELILLLGVAITAPWTLRAQQKPMPVLGYLNATSPGPFPPYVVPFHEGLSFPGCAICLPTASITAPICAGFWPNLANGQSRSSRAPPGLLAFNSCRADGLSSEPSPGSTDWQRTSRPQYSFKHALVQDAAHGSLLRSNRQQLHAQIAQALETLFPDLMDNRAPASAKRRWWRSRRGLASSSNRSRLGRRRSSTQLLRRSCGAS